jgi:hypothetical protein
MRLRHTILALCVALASCGSRKPMPVTVEPFYDANGCKIAVGKYSVGLSTTDPLTLLKIVAEMKEEWSELTPEAMYVTAIRLYDLGYKDEAVYWFYSAQYRARLIQGLIDPGKLRVTGNPAAVLIVAHTAFMERAGKYINGYAFGDIEKLLKTVAQVQTEGVRLPLLKELYPNVHFIEESRWQKVNYTLSTGFSEYMQSVRDSADQIRARRKASGDEGKY